MIPCNKSYKRIPIYTYFDSLVPTKHLRSKTYGTQCAAIITIAIDGLKCDHSSVEHLVGLSFVLG